MSAFVLASLLLAVTPGPGVFYIVARAVGQGRAAGLASVGGVACGNAGNAVGAALGLAAVLELWSGAFIVVKWLGAAYLVWLGWRLWRSAGRPAADAAVRTLPPVLLSRLWRDGFVVALLNPKTTLFFAAFVPQFIDPARPLLSQAIGFGCVFVGIAALTDATYALLAASIAPRLGGGRSAARAAARASGASLIALGVLGAAAGSGPRGRH